MPFNQDDQRERAMVAALNLQQRPDRARHEEDAYLDIDVDGVSHQLLFECKSSPQDGDFGTGRDTGLKKLEQWADFHFVFGWFAARDNVPIQMWYGSPGMMSQWIADETAYIGPDLILASLVPSEVDDKLVSAIFGDKQEISYAEMHRVMKDHWNVNVAEGRPDSYDLNADVHRSRRRSENVYSREAALKAVRDRTTYLLKRGATVNNRKISGRYVVDNCVALSSKAWARSLQQAVEDAIRSESLPR